jgi:periplasmic copper chaperone A
MVAGIALLATMLACPAAIAHSHKKKGLQIVHPWTFATSKPGGEVRVCMKIKNSSGAPDRLVGVTTLAAAKAELRAGEGSAPAAAIDVAAGSQVELDTKGPHILLSGVKKRLNAYDTFKLTLVFEKTGRVIVDVQVEEDEQGSAVRH